MPINKFKPFANQKLINIKIEDTKNSKEVVSFREETLFKAMRELTHLELQLYIYLGACQDGYLLALSPQDISEEIGCNKRALQKVVNSFIEKGYLIQDKCQKNRYTYVQRVDNDVPCKEAMEE